MKKILLVIIAFAFVSTVSAQEIKFGVKAGLNISNISAMKINGNKGDAADMIVGMHAGAFANFSFSDLLGLQPEVLFNMQGGKEEDVTTHLNYISIPILLDIKPFKDFSILVGPQIGFNVYKSISDDETTIKGSDYEDFLKSLGLKSNALDFAAIIGVQYTFIDHLSVGVRYNWGFTKTIQSDASGIEVSGGTNGVIQATIGWRF
jgi:opacity protein-like surface antigen